MEISLPSDLLGGHAAHAAHHGDGSPGPDPRPADGAGAARSARLSSAWPGIVAAGRVAPAPVGPARGRLRRDAGGRRLRRSSAICCSSWWRASRSSSPSPYIRQTGHGARRVLRALLLFSTLGMMIMAGSLDLMTIFLGLETLSISLYILAGFLREQLKSNESALKYLLLGAFASGFLLYGIALVYGATGSINLRQVAQALAGGQAEQPDAPHDRDGSPDRRVRLQGGRGAVPHVDPGRVRGGAHLGDGLHDRRDQGSSLRRLPADPDDGAAGACSPTGAGCSGSWRC